MLLLLWYLWQVVLMKDKRKVFTLDNLGYEPEAGALHPGGGTAAVGGAVRRAVFVVVVVIVVVVLAV